LNTSWHQRLPIFSWNWKNWDSHISFHFISFKLYLTKVNLIILNVTITNNYCYLSWMDGCPDIYVLILYRHSFECEMRLCQFLSNFWFWFCHKQIWKCWKSFLVIFQVQNPHKFFRFHVLGWQRVFNIFRKTLLPHECYESSKKDFQLSFVSKYEAFGI